ncbi:uncharacterized protein LOC123523958 [Mercenaria mercenaria]|uniref:uncharacterized protein LOC123523958 n=1 Tax=Mercenaria mercenaria TaxID=6596 RepID=UPI001E1E1611|nr:uncharacterized protein LOC123523956 isoform X1 [Mercenaria mercenaria]XP_053387772.1 uncharacterized protein LOC123523958 [Mercenaria mercenaria]
MGSSRVRFSRLCERDLQVSHSSGKRTTLMCKQRNGGVHLRHTISVQQGAASTSFGRMKNSASCLISFRTCKSFGCNGGLESGGRISYLDLFSMLTLEPVSSNAVGRSRMQSAKGIQIRL